MRNARAAWLVLFLVPLSWWADRGCNVLGVDPLYHATLWIHERLGWAIASVALASAVTVLWKVSLARRRFSRLLAVAEPLPPLVARAFERAAAEMGLAALPRIAYLDIDRSIATTVVGPVVLLSRGFLAGLNDADLVLVARHELVHAAHRDGLVGVLWHLVFAALLVPGFEPLERRLHAWRERRANLTASEHREEAYLALMTRAARGTGLCAGAGLGIEAAARRSEDRWLMWLAPVALFGLAIALPLSHAEFMHDRSFLLNHHC